MGHLFASRYRPILIFMYGARGPRSTRATTARVPRQGSNLAKVLQRDPNFFSVIAEHSKHCDVAGCPHIIALVSTTHHPSSRRPSREVVTHQPPQARQYVTSYVCDDLKLFRLVVDIFLTMSRKPQLHSCPLPQELSYTVGSRPWSIMSVVKSPKRC